MAQEARRARKGERLLDMRMPFAGRRLARPVGDPVVPALLGEGDDEEDAAAEEDERDAGPQLKMTAWRGTWVSAKAFRVRRVEPDLELVLRPPDPPARLPEFAGPLPWRTMPPGSVNSWR
jgi:hypothetical protein